MRRTLARATRTAVRLLGIKEKSELKFWTDVWDKTIRDGGLWGPDTLSLSGDHEVSADYLGRRWQQARAEVIRVLQETEIEDPDFFLGKTVIDIGPGCVGFPDACPAAVSIGVDPLGDGYARSGLLLDSKAVYLAVPAERIPIRDESVDVVVSRNSLDHVDDPRAVIDEVRRLLRPGGHFLLNVDVEHPPSPTEPHELTVAQLKQWLAGFEIDREIKWDHSHADDDSEEGYAVVFVARKPGDEKPVAEAARMATGRTGP
jgi:SAM-dependent methyltransferase